MAAMQFIDCVSYMLRLSGKRIGLISLGYSAQVFFNNASRLVVMVTFPIIGILVDDGASEDILMAGWLSCLLTVALLICILLFDERIQRIGIWMIRRLFAKQIGKDAQTLKDSGAEVETEISEMVRKRSRKTFLIAFFVYVLYSLNLFSIPFVASFFPENRVFIVQLSPALNAAGTFLLAYFIDPTFSVAVDKNEAPLHTLKSIISARIFANALCAATFFILLYLDPLDLLLA
ncbi:MAG: DUF2837 family protein [Parasphingorhabdus sp.]